MNVKAFTNHIKKTRPVYANWLIWLEKKLAVWRKGYPKIRLIAPCPNCLNGGAKLTHYKWFKTPAHYGFPFTFIKTCRIPAILL